MLKSHENQKPREPPLLLLKAEPFTDKSLDILFHASRLLALHPSAPFVSRVVVLYTLMKLSRRFGAFKTARQALEQLRQLKAPPHFRGPIDEATLEIRAMPFADADEFQPMCYRLVVVGDGSGSLENIGTENGKSWRTSTCVHF